MFAVQSTNQDAASGQHLSQAGTLSLILKINLIHYMVSINHQIFCYIYKIAV